MKYRFRDWCECPDCGECEDISTLAYKTDIVFECYRCGLVSEFVVGEAISPQNPDIDAIPALAEEQSTD